MKEMTYKEIDDMNEKKIVRDKSVSDNVRQVSAEKMPPPGKKTRTEPKKKKDAGDGKKQMSKGDSDKGEMGIHALFNENENEVVLFRVPEYFEDEVKKIESIQM